MTRIELNGISGNAECIKDIDSTFYVIILVVTSTYSLPEACRIKNTITIVDKRLRVFTYIQKNCV